MRIGEFAKRAGVTSSKVRFYEARGLLPASARSGNGYRRYDLADLRVLSFVHRARALGFPLATIAGFMSRPAQERSEKAGVIEAMEAKLAEVERHIAEARDRQRELERLLVELRGQAAS